MNLTLTNILNTITLYCDYDFSITSNKHYYTKLFKIV